VSFLPPASSTTISVTSGFMIHPHFVQESMRRGFPFVIERAPVAVLRGLKNAPEVFW